MSGQLPTGQQLVVALRTAAHARAMTVSEFVTPLTNCPNSFLGQLGNARTPQPATIARIRALIDGQPIPLGQQRASRRKVEYPSPGSADISVKNPTGQQLVLALRAAAQARSTTVSELIWPLTRWPKNFLNHLGNVRNPKPSTIARIRALIDGDPIPGIDQPGTLAAAVAREATDQGERPTIARRFSVVEPLALPDRPSAAPADRIDREPCPYCAVRGDIGCRHRPLYPEGASSGL